MQQSWPAGKFHHTCVPTFSSHRQARARINSGKNIQTRATTFLSVVAIAGLQGAGANLCSAGTKEKPESNTGVGQVPLRAFQAHGSLSFTKWPQTAPPPPPQPPMHERHLLPMGPKNFLVTGMPVEVRFRYLLSKPSARQGPSIPAHDVCVKTEEVRGFGHVHMWPAWTTSNVEQHSSGPPAQGHFFEAASIWC